MLVESGNRRESSGATLSHAVELTIQQIIDGFGSYVDDFMQCDVFRGIGGVAHKYYLLFQHHLAPPVSSYTTGMVVSSDTRALLTTKQTCRRDLQQLEALSILDS